MSSISDNVHQIVSHSVMLGHHLASSLEETVKKHKNLVHEHLKNANNEVSKLEDLTHSKMDELHGDIGYAMNSLKKNPPDWNDVKEKISMAIERFKKLL